MDFSFVMLLFKTVFIAAMLALTYVKFVKGNIACTVTGAVITYGGALGTYYGNQLHDSVGDANVQGQIIGTALLVDSYIASSNPQTYVPPPCAPVEYWNLVYRTGNTGFGNPLYSVSWTALVTNWTYVLPCVTLQYIFSQPSNYTGQNINAGCLFSATWTTLSGWYTTRNKAFGLMNPSQCVLYSSIQDNGELVTSSTYSLGTNVYINAGNVSTSLSQIGLYSCASVVGNSVTLPVLPIGAQILNAKNGVTNVWTPVYTYSNPIQNLWFMYPSIPNLVIQQLANNIVKKISLLNYGVNPGDSFNWVGRNSAVTMGMTWNQVPYIQPYMTYFDSMDWNAGWYNIYSLGSATYSVPLVDAHIPYSMWVNNTPGINYWSGSYNGAGYIVAPNIYLAYNGNANLSYIDTLTANWISGSGVQRWTKTEPGEQAVYTNIVSGLGNNIVLPTVVSYSILGNGISINYYDNYATWPSYSILQPDEWNNSPSTVQEWYRISIITAGGDLMIAG